MEYGRDRDLRPANRREALTAFVMDVASRAPAPGRKGTRFFDGSAEPVSHRELGTNRLALGPFATDAQLEDFRRTMPDMVRVVLQ